MDAVEVGRLAAEAAYQAGAVERAISLLAAALATLGAGGDPVRRAQLLEAQARALRDLGRNQEAIDALEAAAAELPAEPPSAARSSILAALAQAHARVDLRRSTTEAERAIAAAEAAGCAREAAIARITLGSAKANLGEPLEGLALVQEGLEGARAVGDVDAALRGFVNVSDTLAILGRHEEAIEAAEAGDGACRALRLRAHARRVPGRQPHRVAAAARPLGRGRGRARARRRAPARARACSPPRCTS